MRRFDGKEELKAAKAYAGGGGQALLVIPHGCPVGPRTPMCFRNAREYGYLFDQDPLRLSRTVQALGVSKLEIDHLGEPSQHVNLCGRPLLRAVARCQA